MIVMECNQPVYFDVDDTLIYWKKPKNYKEAMINVVHDGIVDNLAVNWDTVKNIKAHKIRGHTVVVWSSGGSKWVESAVKSLGLEDFVDLVLEKPMWFYDDMPPETFMKNNLFKK